MSTLRTNTLSNASGSKSVPVDTVVDGTAKAWVNFNGTGTVAIRAAFNVSSITDNGTGNYTVNFTTAMPDANYAIATSTNSFTSTDPGGGLTLKLASTSPSGSPVLKTASQARFINGGSSGLDSSELNVSIFR